MHRDIKGANLLLNNKGELKLTDFGLARKFVRSNQRINFTNRVVTLWYRAPELILGSNSYNTGIDLWSVGCFLVEMLLAKPIFPGKNEAMQIDLIFSVLGTPTEENWPGVSSLKDYESMSTKKYPNRLHSWVKARMRNGQKLDEPTFDLIEKLLELDPEK
jgi:serine/threonine protein kinase